jgi:hypothetical protein
MFLIIVAAVSVNVLLARRRERLEGGRRLRAASLAVVAPEVTQR